MNALYQNTLLFAFICGFSFVAIAWLALGTLALAVTRRTYLFWLGGSFGAAVVSVALWLNSVRLTFLHQEEAAIGILIGAAIALLIARHLRVRSDARNRKKQTAS